jgi:hypothetical protein
MYATSHKNAKNLEGAKRVSEWCQKGARRVPKGCQTTVFFGEDFSNAEGVKDSVSFSLFHLVQVTHSATLVISPRGSTDAQVGGFLR